MNQAEMMAGIEVQRKWFAEGHTRPVEARLEVLRNLRTGLVEMEDEIARALQEDLGKSAVES